MTRAPQYVFRQSFDKPLANKVWTKSGCLQHLKHATGKQKCPVQPSVLLEPVFAIATQTRLQGRRRARLFSVALSGYGNVWKHADKNIGSGTDIHFSFYERFEVPLGANITWR